ncbi:MAG: EAL domain-containing protein [Rhodocyclaceae bacterium]|nr:EAL domain-containing protein [Rhodocyclaceae bacterium]
MSGKHAAGPPAQAIEAPSPPPLREGVRGRLPAWVLRAAVIMLAYPLLGVVSRELALPGYATAVWPPAGVALGALLVWGRAYAPAVWFGALSLNLYVATLFGASLATPQPWLSAASIALGASLHGLFGASLTRRAHRRDPDLRQASTSLHIMLIGGPVACLVSAGWGVGTLLAVGLLDPGDAPFSLLTWWVGDTLGVLLFTPLFLVASQGRKGIWARRWTTVALPLVLATAAVVAVFLVAAEQEQARIEREFQQQARAVAKELDMQVVRYEDTVAALRGFARSHERATRQAFADFVAPLIARLPGLHALAWDAWVHGSDRAAFEAEARALGHPGFTIRSWAPEGGWRSGIERDAYLAVLHIEPIEANAAALGIDLMSHPQRRRTVDAGRQSGHTTASEAFRLIQETGNQAGILLMAPVFRAEGPAAGGDAFAGMAVAVFRLGEVVAPVLANSVARSLRGRLEDRTEARAPDTLLAFQVGRNGALEWLDPSRYRVSGGLPSAEHCMAFAERVWCLHLDAADGYVASRRSWSAWAVLSSGILFCGLLGLNLLASSGRAASDSARAEELARINQALSREVGQRQRAEAALAEEKERAEVTLHSIGEGVVTTDIAGRITYLNPVAERILGWRTAEALGRPSSEVVVLVDEDSRKVLDDPLTACLARRRTTQLDGSALLIARGGQSYAIQDSASPIVTPEGGLIGAVMVFNDVTEHRRLSREAIHLATHDALTGLVNRREFERRLERVFDSRRQRGGDQVLCFIDLDRFKAVNDTAGHRAGDELLRQITRMLSRHVRERDTLARIGGDEFALLFDNCPLEKALEICQALVSAVAGLGFVWEDQAYEVGASIGLVAMADQRSVEQWLAQADAACYTAKDRGRGRVHLYAGEASDATDEALGREVLRTADIREAIADGRLVLHAQPIIDVAQDARPVRLQEVLVRLRTRSGQLLLPASFLSAAERYGLMGGIDHWVINHVVAHFERLQAGDPGTRVSINLSAVALSDERLGDELLRLIAAHGIPPDCLCFEIAESIVVRNGRAVAALMHQLRPAGVAFALDDVGSGLSSLGGLGALPMSYLKIAGSLCNHAHEPGAARAIIEALVVLCERRGVDPIATRVEVVEAVPSLKALGIRLLQGRAIEGPHPIDSRIIAS